MEDEGLMEEVFSADDIEAIMEDMEYIPGYFHLELNLNGEAAGPAELRRRDTLLRLDGLRTEVEAESGYLQYAVRNLQGFLAFHLEQLEAAEGRFRDICKEDPGNLNAWANLGYVYDKQGREVEAGECAEKVSQLMGLDGGDASQEESRMLAARCLAEQAYAQPYDVELDTEEELRDRLSTALTLYNRALDYAGDLVHLEEKRSWYFKMATIYIRLDDIVKTKNDSEYSRLSHYNQGLRFLTEALKSKKTELKALSWCYIGILLERKEEFSTVPMSIHDCGLSGSDPLTCHGTAIKLASDNALVLNTLAKLFFTLGKQEMAMGICNMALSVLPDPELNYQAYCTRAKINMMAYVRDLERYKQGEGEIPDRLKLAEAKADLEKVVHGHPCLRTHMAMAQVLYYSGVDALQERLLVDEGAVNSALVSLSQALQHQPAHSLPELHLLRGRCLLLKGEEQNAADCFSRAMELERAGRADPMPLRCLLETLLALFAQGGAESGPGPVVTQLEEGLHRAEQRYTREVVQDELRHLYRSHNAEVTELSRALIKAGRLDLVKRLLDTIQLKPPGSRRVLCKSYSVA